MLNLRIWYRYTHGALRVKYEHLLNKLGKKMSAEQEKIHTKRQRNQNFQPNEMGWNEMNEYHFERWLYQRYVDLFEKMMFNWNTHTNELYTDLCVVWCVCVWMVHSESWVEYTATHVAVGHRLFWHKYFSLSLGWIFPSFAKRPLGLVIHYIHIFFGCVLVLFLLSFCSQDLCRQQTLHNVNRHLDLFFLFS